MQEYRCLLTLEELQAIVGQCLHRLRELCTGEACPARAEVWGQSPLATGWCWDFNSSLGAEAGGQDGPSLCHPHCILSSLQLCCGAGQHSTPAPISLPTHRPHHS